MAIKFVNGKQVNLPDAVTHSEVVKASGFEGDSSSRVVKIYDGTNNPPTTLLPGQRGSIPEGGRAEVAPDRVKGTSSGTFFGTKQPWQKQVIAAQVAYVSKNYFPNEEVELDDDCHSVVFSGFHLPDVWSRANGGKKSVRMMMVFPDQYPDLPTNGFYLPSTLNVPPSGNPRFYDRAYHDAFGQDLETAKLLKESGWKWVCTQIKPGCWTPAKIRNIDDWQKGDSLRELIQLCFEVMTDPTKD